MYGLDRAGIYTEVETEILYVKERLEKLFPNSYSESLSKKTTNYEINKKNINKIKLEKKHFSTIIRIDFSYPRFFEENNIVPLTDELKKIIVEENLTHLINQIIDYKISSDDLYYDFLEFTIQENVKNFYKYHNIIAMFYKGLTRKYKDLDKVQYYNFSKSDNQFYTTGFIFQPFQGWKIRLYSKGHENNKNNLQKVKGAILRLEHRLTKKIIIKNFNTNKIKNITIQSIANCINKNISKNLADILIAEINLSKEILEKKFKGFRCNELNSLVRDNLEWILDEKIIDDIITNLTTRSYSRVKVYRQKVREILLTSQSQASPKRDFFGNIERLEIFFNNLILANIKVKCNTKKHLTFLCQKWTEKTSHF